MTDTQTQSDTDVGNTSSTSDPRGRLWFITWNNPPDTADTDIKGYVDKYHYQYEVGENGTRHIQGVLEFKNPRKFSQVKMRFPGVHLEKCRNKKAALDYCHKDETSTGGRESNMVYKPKDHFCREEASDWQINILEMIDREPDERSVHWYWSEEGGVGKTTLAKHICLHNKDAIYVGGAGKDILYAVSEYIKENDGRGPRIVMFDITRAAKDKTSYDAIEKIKNGIFFSGKYEGCMCIFDNPHVIVFANEAPQLTKLSEDRWHVQSV